MSLVVYGIPFDDEITAYHVRKVIRASVVMAVISLATAIYNLIYQLSLGDDIAEAAVYFVVNLLLLFVLPACGYFGAQKRDQSLIVCFSWGSGCFSFLGFVSLWSLVYYYATSVGSVFLVVASTISQAFAAFYGCQLMQDEGFRGEQVYVQFEDYRNSGVPVAIPVHVAPSAYMPSQPYAQYSTHQQPNEDPIKEV